MEKKQLPSLLEGNIFRIPDYQRGYSWDEKNWLDLVQDIDSLIEEQSVQSHYTGTIVIYKSNIGQQRYGTRSVDVLDVVDGQQRLTTCSLYLAVILKRLINLKQDDFRDEVRSLLYSGDVCRLSLNNNSADIYFDLIKSGIPNIPVVNPHQKRLLDAYNYFNEHINSKRRDQGELHYLKSLFDVITRKLNFTFYSIEVESEVGMTFELMNSRGKDLSILELLKNYLMYWAYRNGGDSRQEIEQVVNRKWKDVYTNISGCHGDETQCLRIAWVLYQNHSPKSWEHYDGFKSDSVIPLRNFTKKDKTSVASYIKNFSDFLAVVSRHYAAILKPLNSSPLEYKQLTRISRIGNTANFLPLIIAARIKVEQSRLSENDYIDLLVALEKTAYRVFLWEGKRSNTGLSSFYRWGFEVYHEQQMVSDVISWVYATINYYSNEDGFRKRLGEPGHWYANRRLLKYSLYEYELYLLDTEGKKSSPYLDWSQLSDATIEHIYPQNPSEDSLWVKVWDKKDAAYYLHDVGNLVLTKNNANYQNFDFEVKKGSAGRGYCYANSDIRQERKLAEYSEWTVQSCEVRRKVIVDWIVSRWGNDNFHTSITSVEINEEDDDIDM